MLLHFGIEGLTAGWPGSVVSIGVFDGVHLGHRALLSKAVARATELGMPSIALTFDRNPAALLAPERCPPVLSPLEENLRLIAEQRVGICVVLAFDLALAATTATEFYDKVLIAALHASEVVVGHDFTFGRDRTGTAAWLEERLTAHVLEPQTLDGRRISSTAIRAAVAEGKMQDAERLLGRPFALGGVVVGGQRLGRQLGFPTLNLAPTVNQVLPMDGIYAGRCRTSEGVYPAAISIGVRPTVGAGGLTVEAYLLGYSGRDLYGEPCRLEVVQRIRDEARFEDLESLRRQIAEDVRQIAELSL